ncbi:PEP-CTERM sorting domain-containing protein [Thalassotalea sp. 1_MG-2023]|uniref:PEP-CTERM sorting domain-containing protein n=1 Tax=Thalassotalea sp. 1_MG-2023 TaxID=3062680 RepID=UPI0026E132AF|nr:PEP-CTERM sorting domain-containing protein [Thalassotalea sp. 1_MG-2023]MDO6427902.1 PEP-CTERM sorting domain-containing protein [Thalassotalea sp. 1_MG-2023]
MKYHQSKVRNLLSVALLLGYSSFVTANIYDFQNTSTGFNSDNAHFSLLGIANNSVLAHENTMFSFPIDELNQQGRTLEVISDNNAVSGVFSENELFVYVNEVDEDVAVTVRVVNTLNVRATEFSLTINVVNKPTLAIDTYAAPQFVSAELGEVIVGETQQWLTGFVGNSYIGSFDRRIATVSPTSPQVSTAFTQKNMTTRSFAIGTSSDQLIPILNQTNPATQVFFASNNIAESFAEQPIGASVPMALLTLGKEKAALIAEQTVGRLFRQSTTDPQGGTAEGGDNAGDGLGNDNVFEDVTVGDEHQGTPLDDINTGSSNAEQGGNGGSTGDNNSPNTDEIPLNPQNSFNKAPQFSEVSHRKGSSPIEQNIAPVKIPEPSSIMLMLLALGSGLFIWNRKKIK